MILATVHAMAILELGVMGEPLPAGGFSSADRMRGKVCLVTARQRHWSAAALKMAGEGAGGGHRRGPARGGNRGGRGGLPGVGSAGARGQDDVAEEDQVERLVATAVDRYGGLDVAFNNAGFQERRAPLEGRATPSMTRCSDTNVRSVFLCLRHQLPVMFARGVGRSSSTRR